MGITVSKETNMDERPLIVLLGDSLLMDGVAMSLADGRRLGVVQMDASITDIGERLRSLKPELILFELDSPGTPAVFSLLREEPDTLLLGLDRDSSHVIVLNGSRHPTRSMQELGQLVQLQVGCNA
jgi:hypothetical protein